MFSGLWYFISQMKPFNPILGETLEGFFVDGTKISVEHISHHPPISSFIIEDFRDWYKYHGLQNYKVNFKFPNGFTGKREGLNTIDFSDGSRVEFDYPDIILRGLLFGKRIFGYGGKISFKMFGNENQNI